MSTSTFFNKFENVNEQRLYEDLIIESIEIHGIDLYYLPRSIVDMDILFGDDPSSQFDDALMVEMYVKDVEGFGGEGDFLQKFGLEIRDQVTLSVSKLKFETTVGTFANISRPREGDLIWFPLNNKVFEIKFAEHEPVFYPFGALNFYDLTVELFEYSSERFDTGVDVIDDVEKKYSQDTLNWEFTLEDETGDLILETGDNLIRDDYIIHVQDPFSNNVFYESEGKTIIDFSETDPFSEGGVY